MGNFLVGFTTAFGAVSLVDGADLSNKLLIGLVAGATQGFMAVGKEYLAQGDTSGQKKKKKDPMASLPPMMLVF